MFKFFRAWRGLALAFFLVAAIGVAVINAHATTTSTTSTTPVADTTPPIISSVTRGSITETSAYISWTTNEPATTQVQYGTNTSYGQTTLRYSSLLTAHSVTISGLHDGTTYHYRVVSADSAGNEATSPDYTFTTPAAYTTLPPTSNSGACSTDANCAVGPGAGATFCDNTGKLLQQYLRINICSSGSCIGTTRSQLGVAQDCGAAGQVCGFTQDGGGTFKCVPPTTAQCVIGSQITSACMCGNVSYSNYGYCCLDSFTSKPYQNYTTCPAYIPPPATSSSTSTPAATPTPSATSTSTPTPTPTPTPALSSYESSLIGYWKFDGNGNNEIAGKPNAVTVGSAIFNSSGGKFGGYLYIPGSSDWAKIPYNSAYDLPNDFTVEFWFRQRADRSFFQDLVYKGNPINNYNFRVFRQLWNQYNFGPIIAGHTAVNTGYWTQASNPNQLAHNVWHHVAYANSSGAHAYYLDGAPIYSSSQSSEYAGPARTPAVDIIIGDSAVDTDIDNLKIYNRMLSASEVLQNSGFPPPAPPPPPPPPPPQFTSPTTTSSTVQTPVLFTPPVSSTSTTNPLFPTAPVVLPPPPTLPPPFITPPWATPTSTLVPPTQPGPSLTTGLPIHIIYICFDGTKVSSPAQCLTISEDPARLCVKKGGIWCHGACASDFAMCAQTQPLAGATSTPGFFETKLLEFGDEQARELERQKTYLLRELRTMELFFSQIKNSDARQKVLALRTKMEGFKPSDLSAYKIMNDFQQALQDLRDLMQQTNTEPGFDKKTVNARVQGKALAQMKRGLKSFDQHIEIISQKVAGLEKQGIVVGTALKETLAQAKDVVARVASAKNYDDIKAIAARLPDIGQALNEYLPKLEALSRLPRIIQLAERRIASSERVLKQTTALVQRLKLDVDQEIAPLRANLAEAKAGVAAIKSGSLPDDQDLSDYTQEHIFDVVNEIVNGTDQLRVLVNVRQFVTKSSSDVSRYNARIRRLERAGKKMTEGYDLLEQLKKHLQSLRPLSARALKPETADQVIEFVRAINDIEDQLNEIVGVNPASALEQELERIFNSSAGKVQSFAVDNLENLIVD